MPAFVAMERTLCVWAPQFELYAQIEAQSLSNEHAVVLANPGTARAVVSAVSWGADRCGVRCGMPLAMARALCDDLVVVAPAAQFAREVKHRLLRALYQHAPIVGDDGGDAFFVSLRGMEALARDELCFALNVSAAVAAMRLPHAIAVCDTPMGAWVAAKSRRINFGDPATRCQPLVVPVGTAAQFIDTLPVDLLPISSSIKQLFALLGWQTVAQLRALPPGALMKRFGRQGARLEAQLQANVWASHQLFHPAPIAEPIDAFVDLDFPLRDVEPLLFVYKGLLDRVVKQVVAQRGYVACLCHWVNLADRGQRQLTHTIRPVLPVRQTAPLLELVALWLEQVRLEAPVERVGVRVDAMVGSVARQLNLFDRRQQLAQDAFDAIVAKLSAAFGEQAVVKPRAIPRYRLEGRLKWQPARLTDRSVDEHSAEHASSDPRAMVPSAGSVLCMLKDPVPVRWIGSRRFRIEGEAKPRRLVSVRGPYRFEGEWWEAPFVRDYFVVVDAQAATLILCREHGQPFQLHAIID